MLSRATSLARPAPRRVLGAVRTFLNASAPEQCDLTEEFPGTPTGTPTASGDNTVTVSTLSNGFRVASANGYGGGSSIGLVLDLGSKHEADGAEGSAHLLKHSIFKENMNRSHIRLSRDLENIGASTTTSSGRETSSYSIDCMRGDVPTAVEMLSEAVTKPRFLDYDISDYLDVAHKDAAEANKVAEHVLGEALHAAAYYDDSALGRPSLVTSSTSVSADDLTSFLASRANASNMVLSGVGVDHVSLVKVAETHFGGLEKGTSSSKTSAYVGGEYRVPGASAQTHVAIGFNFGGYEDAHLTALNVLKASLGAYSVTYSGTGIFALAGSSDADEAGGLVSALVGNMKAAASTPLTDEALAGAKASLLASTAFAAESRGSLMEDIGTQLLVNDRYESPKDLASKVEAVSAADVQAAAKTLLSSAPSIASVGDVSKVPRVADVKAML